MRTRGFSCERAGGGENAILEKKDTQNTEPMKLRYRNNSQKVGSKVKKTSFEMTLRSQSVGSENRIHKSKHKSNQPFENEADRYNINKTKTKETFGGEKSFELKSDSIRKRVKSKRKKSVVANLGLDSTRENGICAKESNGRKKSKQATISGDNEIDRDNFRRSERLKRKLISNEVEETQAKKKKESTSSINKHEETHISSQKSDDAKEETDDTDLTELHNSELSRDTVQAVIRKVLPTFVDHMDPKKIADRMLESNSYRPSILRDIMDNGNTSDRNRKLLEWISRSDVSVYTHFKQCLLETKQNDLFTLLETTEKDGDTREITTNIKQNTIQLNSEGNKLYSELVTRADLRDKQIICLEFENIGTPVCRALFEKKVNDSKPKDDTGLTWTIDTFLNSKRETIEQIDSHIVKLGINNIFPRAKLDSWRFSLFCHILINTCEMTPSLRHCLEWLLEHREKVSQYNDENQKRKLSKLRKHFMIIAAETEDDDLIKTVEERLSRLERGVLPNTDCEVIDTSLQRTKKELIEEIKCNRASIDSCIQGQSEVKNDVIKATTTVKILVKGSESEQTICSQIVQAFRCHETSQLSYAVNEVCTQFQSKDWTVIDAKVGCIELYIQCSSVVSLLALLRDYANGNLDTYLKPLEKAARMLDGCVDLKFETFFHAETVDNILSSLDFRQFEMKSNDVYEENPDHGQTNSTKTADIAFVEVINVQGSELDNLRVASDEGNDLPEENSNSKTRLVLLGLNFGNESEKVENNIPDTNGHKESLELTEYRLWHSPTSAMSDSGSQNAKPTRLKRCDGSPFPVKNSEETTSSLELKEHDEGMHLHLDRLDDILNSIDMKIYAYLKNSEETTSSLELKEHDEGMHLHLDRLDDILNSEDMKIYAYLKMYVGIWDVELNLGMTIQTKEVHNKDGEILYIHKVHDVSKTGAAFVMHIRDGDEILLLGEDNFAPVLTKDKVLNLLRDVQVDGKSRFSMVLQRRDGNNCCLIETSAILARRDLHSDLTAGNVRMVKSRKNILYHRYRLSGTKLSFDIHDDGIPVNVVKGTDADNNKILCKYIRISQAKNGDVTHLATSVDEQAENNNLCFEIKRIRLQSNPTSFDIRSDIQFQTKKKSRYVLDDARPQIIREHSRKVSFFLPGGMAYFEDQDETKAASEYNRRGNFEHFGLALCAERYFEIKRRGLLPSKFNRTYINLPISLTEKYQSKLDRHLVCEINLLKQSDQAQLQFIRDNKLTFSSEPFKSRFKCLIEKMTILDQVIILDMAIIMAGGYSDSQRLQSIVKANLPRIKNVMLQEEVTSFLKGVLTCTNMPRQIPNLVLKFTYGIKSNLRFREGIDPEGKRMQSDKGDTCKQRFTKHFEKGQSVNVGEPQTEISYSPLNKSQTRMCLHIYASDLEEPQYTDDKCTFVGKLIVDLSNHGDLNRYVNVSLTFKDNEIVVTARDKKTGKKSAVAFASLG